MGFLLWIEEGPLGIFIRESLWGYPIVLSTHGVGMAIVVGVVVGLTLRTMGFAKSISVPAYGNIFYFGWFGFLINLVSGLILFAGSASIYTFQGSFQLKLGLILLGGILMKLIMNSVREGRNEGTIKALSAVCLASWFGAVITGRLMAYL